VVIDERIGSAELELLAEGLATPCQIGDYILEGRISKTSTALIFVARGGAFGKTEGVLKLTGEQYAPLLERELGLLNRCKEGEVHGIVQPLRTELEWIEVEGDDAGSVAAILLPFLAGGDLVQWIGAHATRTGRLGARLALEVGELVGGVLCSLLRLPRPLVHGDVKPQNVLLPRPGAPLAEVTLIDLDASEELEVDVKDLALASRETRQHLVDDVNGFGELLYMLATGREPPSEGEPNPETGNPAFDTLVRNCLTSEPEGPGYVCLADNGLWRDLERALAVERVRNRPKFTWRFLAGRPALAVLGVMVFGALMVALASKLLIV
jgi:serine/threonine protein kinase